MENTMVCEIDNVYVSLEEEADGSYVVSIYNGFRKVCTETVDAFDVYDALDAAVDMVCSMFHNIDRASIQVQETDADWFMSRIAD